MFVFMFMLFLFVFVFVLFRSRLTGGTLECWRGATGAVLARACVEVKLGWRARPEPFIGFKISFGGGGMRVVNASVGEGWCAARGGAVCGCAGLGGGGLDWRRGTERMCGGAGLGGGLNCGGGIERVYDWGRV
jgi:hypothetical protein